MTHSDHDLSDLAGRLGEALLGAGRRFAAAESCTGGWVAKAATDIAGSSSWFDRGFVTYSNEAKQELLGVSAATLATHGAVSAEVVAEMAQGALRRSRADLAVAISGVAGPGGGSDAKPVGTVWFAWASADGSRATELIRFEGDRDAVRRAAVAHALEGARRRATGGTNAREGDQS